MLTANQTPTEKSPRASLSARQQINHALLYNDFERLQNALSVTAERLAKETGAHPRTLQRRRKEGKFTFVESDRLYRFQDLFRRAAEALESEAAAASWLTRPSPRFEGLSPLEYAATEPGHQELLLVIESIADDSFG